MESTCFLTSTAKTSQAVGGTVDALTHGLRSGADLAFVFATRHHINGLRGLSAQLRERLGCRAVIGAAVSGVMGQGRSVSRGPGLSAMAVRLPDAGLNLFDFEHLAKQERGNGSSGSIVDGGYEEDLALKRAVCGQQGTPEEERPPAEAPRLVLLLADLYSTAVDASVQRLVRSFPDTPIVGGRVVREARRGRSGTDPGRAGLLLNDTLLESGAIGLSISGQVRQSICRIGGVRPVSQSVVVTKSSRMVVQELGGRPVYVWLRDWYRDLDESDQQRVRDGELLVGRLVAEHLGGDDPNDFAIRSVGQIRQDPSYLAVQDPGLRPGQTVRFFLPDIRGGTPLTGLGLSASSESGSESGFGLVFADWRRGRRVLGQAEQDAVGASRWLGSGPMIGAEVHGEIGPVGGLCALSAHGVVAARVQTS